METTVIILLAALAIVGAEDSTECKEKREACTLKSLTYGQAWYNTPLKCGVIREMTQCVRNVAEQCLDGDEKVKYMNNLRETLEREGCQAVGEEDAFGRCLYENRDSVLICAAVAEGIARQNILHLRTGDQDFGNVLTCNVHILTLNCIVERISEICSQELNEVMEQHVIPGDIQEACSTEESQAFYSEHPRGIIFSDRKK